MNEYYTILDQTIEQCFTIAGANKTLQEFCGFKEQQLLSIEADYLRAKAKDVLYHKQLKENSPGTAEHYKALAEIKGNGAEFMALKRLYQAQYRELRFAHYLLTLLVSHTAYENEAENDHQSLLLDHAYNVIWACYLKARQGQTLDIRVNTPYINEVAACINTLERIPDTYQLTDTRHHIVQDILLIACPEGTLYKHIKRHRHVMERVTDRFRTECPRLEHSGQLEALELDNLGLQPRS